MRAFHRGIMYGGAPPGLEEAASWGEQQTHTAQIHIALRLVEAAGGERQDIWDDAFWFQDEFCQDTQEPNEGERYQIFDGDTDEETLEKDHAAEMANGDEEDHTEGPSILPLANISGIGGWVAGWLCG